MAVRGAVVLLLALLSVAVVAAENKLLGELMYGSPKPTAARTTASAPAKHSGSPHFEHVNLQLLNRHDCRYIGYASFLTGLWTFDSDIGCDASSGHYDEGLSASLGNGLVGRCEFKREMYGGIPGGNNFDFPAAPIPMPSIPGAGPVGRYGEFSVRCTLNGNAYKCARGVACDGLTFTASGGMYVVENVLAKSTVAPLPIDDDCLSNTPFRTPDGKEIFDVEQDGTAKHRAAKAPAQAPADAAAKAPVKDSVKPASAQYDGYGDSYGEIHVEAADPGPYDIGEAYIYYGTIDTVTSMHGDIDVEGGYFQLIRSFVPDDPFTGSPQGKMVVDPYKMSLKLQMEDKYE